jgi:hypothetical protein
MLCFGVAVGSAGSIVSGPGWCSYFRLAAVGASSGGLQRRICGWHRRDLGPSEGEAQANMLDFDVGERLSGLCRFRLGRLLEG